MNSPRPVTSLLLSLAFCAASAFGGEKPLSSAGELSAALRSRTAAQEAFTFAATVSYVATNAFQGGTNIALLDGTGATLVRIDPNTPLRHLPATGDRIRLSGKIRAFMRDRRFAVLDDCLLLATGTPPAPRPRTLAQLMGTDTDYHLSTTEGVLTDIAYSSVNREWVLLLLRDQTDTLYISAPCSDSAHYRRLAALIGNRVRATGICVPYDHGIRRFIGRLFKVASTDMVQPVDDSLNALPGDLPTLEDLDDMSADVLPAIGNRRTSGHVIAVRSDRSIVLKTSNGDYVGVEFADTTRLPRPGDFIEVVGLPDTDLFRINLLNSTWAARNGPTLEAEPPLDIRPSDLWCADKDDGQQSLHCHRCYAFHGHALSFVGIVRSITRQDDARTLFLESDGRLITVDAGLQGELLDHLPIGSKVRVTGVCVLDVRPRRANSVLAEIFGFTLVLRTPEDLQILARPSWWTAQRLLVMLALGLATLLGTIFWNVSLNRRAKAKGRELAREQLAHASADLKVRERTRLAVELHDALSQMLAGVSMQIDAAAGLVSGTGTALDGCLAIASRTIDACRLELRNTLWDLRSAALDEPDMNAALRKSLSPCLSDIALAIRFDVPRRLFSDNAAHDILRIIRELAANAMRHGQARNVAISGALEDGRLRFSVQDDGCGFEPKSAPGIDEGHFGLQGISERLERLDGEIQVESAPGDGTTVTVVMPFPRSGE